MANRVTEEILVVESSDGTKQTIETFIREKRDFPEQWKIDANECYRGVMGIFLGLASAALTFPVLVLASRPEKALPLDRFINGTACTAYTSWILLAIAIASGSLYFYASAQWVKCAWGKQPRILRWVTEACVEKVLDWTFWITLVCTVAGVVVGIVFAFILMSP